MNDGRYQPRRVCSSVKLVMNIVGDWRAFAIDFVLLFLAVLKQRREADAALFSELHRKLQTQVGIWVFSPEQKTPGLITFLILY